MPAPRFRRIRHIDATLASGPWPYAERHGEAIRSAWAVWTAANPALFNGTVLLLCGGAVEGETFRGRYRAVEFAAFLHFMRLGEPDGVTRNGFGLAGLTGADGALVMGVMGGHTANAGRIYFPGGTPDPSDLVDGRIDLAGSIVRELREETGLSPAELSFDEGFWLHEDDKRLAFIKPIVSPLTGLALAETIRERLAGQDEPELSGVHVVATADDLRPDLMPPFQLAYAEWWLGEGRAAAEAAFRGAPQPG